MMRSIGAGDARLWQTRVVINEFSAASALDKNYEILDYNQE